MTEGQELLPRPPLETLLPSTVGHELAALRIQRNLLIKPDQIRAVNGQIELLSILLSPEQIPTAIAQRRIRLQTATDGLIPTIQQEISFLTAQLHPKTPEINPSSVTSPELIKSRLSIQERYLQGLKDKWNLESKDPRVLRTLYRLNGATAGYYEELESLNSLLPPMSEKCQFSIVIPAYNEEDKIEKMIRGWTEQLSPNNTPVDPELFEIIILINRPNSQREYDHTLQRIDALKKRPPYNKYHIFPVEKTFNFPEKGEIKTTIINGQKIEVNGGVRMGLVYSVAADLAVLRNSQRKNSSVKTNLLLRTGGADAYARNPHFISRTLRIFNENPKIEQYNSRADYPSRIYEHLPLFHVVDRFREIMNLLYTQKKSHLGLGTYRMGLYCEAGGFNPDEPVREEVNLNTRMRQRIAQKVASEEGKRKDYIRRESLLNAIDDPRRTLAALWEGIPILYAYGRFDDRERISQMGVDKILRLPISEKAKLTVANLQYQLEPYVHFYLRQLYQYGHHENIRPDTRTNFSASCKLLKKYLHRTFFFLGLPKENYQLTFLSQIDKATSLDQAAQKLGINPAQFASPNELLKEVVKTGCHLHIKSVNPLFPLLTKYKKRKKPDWTI